MEQPISSETRLSVAVVEAVSAVEEREPTELPLLREVIDPDALDALARSNGDHTIAFEYSQSHVTVKAGESIVVEQRPIRSQRA